MKVLNRIYKMEKGWTLCRKIVCQNKNKNRVRIKNYNTDGNRSKRDGKDMKQEKATKSKIKQQQKNIENAILDSFV